VREAIEHLEKALAHVGKVRNPLAKREKTLDNRVLVRLVANAGLDISAALIMLRTEKEETCEKS